MPSAHARFIESRTFYRQNSAPLVTLDPAIRACAKKDETALAADNLRSMRDQIDTWCPCYAPLGLIATTLAGIVAITGVAAGIPFALTLSHSSKCLLFQIEPTNPTSYTGSALFLPTIALTACLPPVCHIDPIASLPH